MHEFIMALQKRFREVIAEEQTKRLLPGVEKERGFLQREQEQEITQAAFRAISDWFRNDPSGKLAGAYYDAWQKEYGRRKEDNSDADR
jgi:uncharacterized protein (DUF2267 family)